VVKKFQTRNKNNGTTIVLLPKKKKGKTTQSSNKADVSPKRRQYRSARIKKQAPIDAHELISTGKKRKEKLVKFYQQQQQRTKTSQQCTTKKTILTTITPGLNHKFHKHPTNSQYQTTAKRNQP
jgi:hypothetical protein